MDAAVGDDAGIASPWWDRIHSLAPLKRCRAVVTDIASDIASAMNGL